MLEGIHDAEDSDISESIVRKYFENASVELKIQECPKLLYKGPMINTITLFFVQSLHFFLNVGRFLADFTYFGRTFQTCGAW